MFRAVGGEVNSLIEGRRAREDLAADQMLEEIADPVGRQVEIAQQAIKFVAR